MRNITLISIFYRVSGWTKYRISSMGTSRLHKGLRKETLLSKCCPSMNQKDIKNGVGLQFWRREPEAEMDGLLVENCWQQPAGQLIEPIKVGLGSRYMHLFGGRHGPKWNPTICLRAFFTWGAFPMVSCRIFNLYFSNNEAS